MAIPGSVAAGRASARGGRFDAEFVLQGRRRVAAVALLCAAGFLFMTPPFVAVLVIAGLVR